MKTCQFVDIITMLVYVCILHSFTQATEGQDRHGMPWKEII